MLSISVYNHSQHKQDVFKEGEVWLGSSSDEGSENPTTQAMVVEDHLVSPNQLRFKWIAGGTTVDLANYGRSIALESGPRIHRGRAVTLELPFTFSVGDTQVQVFDTETSHALDFSLTHLSEMGEPTQAGSATDRISPGAQTLAAWLETLGELQRNVAGSQELLDVAARAVFNPGGLDGGMVLMRDKGSWEITATHISRSTTGVGYRQDLVDKAVEQKKTIYHDAEQVDANPAIDDFHTAVVCPIFGADDEVVGVIYGFRSLNVRNNRRGIRLLEAQFVRVVADSLSAGMIRLESEAEAARSNVLLEQVFSPKITKQLQANPTFLESKECEVSVLFADLRKFSTISERIGNRETYELLADVMDRFSKIIRDLDGVIIDFYGDGVSAFWNAPIEQKEHAMFACCAGMEILKSMREVNEIWSDRLGEELRVGIGVHTGLAQVGNSGSRTRIKYGPRGNTVNLASRLETHTKRVGVPMLISGESAAKVEGSFDLQRIIKTTLPGMRTPGDVFQIVPKAEKTYLNEYDAALACYESGDLEKTLNELSELESKWTSDPVVKFLKAETLQMLGRPVEAAVNPGGKTDSKVRHTLFGS